MMSVRFAAQAGAAKSMTPTNTAKSFLSKMLISGDVDLDRFSCRINEPRLCALLHPTDLGNDNFRRLRRRRDGASSLDWHGEKKLVIVAAADYHLVKIRRCRQRVSRRRRQRQPSRLDD